MKSHLCFCLTLTLCGLAATCVRADNDDNQPVKPPHDPDVNSPTYDGSTFSTDHTRTPSADEIAAAREADKENATWLIRSYEEQVKLKRTATGQIDLLDPYQRIISNQDLAKLAGLTPTAAPDPIEVTNLRTTSDSLTDGPTLRPDTSPVSPQSKYPPMSGNGFKPLITPLSATDVAGLHNFYETLPAGTPPPVLANTPGPGNLTPSANEPSIIDMPGITAAGNHLSEGQLSYDLAPEPLPDEPPIKRAVVSSDEKSSDVVPHVPSADAAKQLHRAVVAVTTGNTTPQPTPAKVDIQPDPDLIPKPIPVPIIMAGRPQIQDPNGFMR